MLRSALRSCCSKSESECLEMDIFMHSSHLYIYIPQTGGANVYIYTIILHNIIIYYICISIISITTNAIKCSISMNRA